MGAGRVRRHRADGVQDQKGDHLPDQPAAICTYEMDDTPPFMIDEQALDIAAVPSIDALLKCVPVVDDCTSHPTTGSTAAIPHRLPADDDRRCGRPDFLSRPADSDYPATRAGGGRLPRGAATSATGGRTLDGPPRHAADRDGDRAGDASRRRWPRWGRSCGGWCGARDACGRESARGGRT